MKPDYKNWVPKGLLYGMFAATALTLACFLIFGVCGVGVHGSVRVALGAVFAVACLACGKYAEWCIHAYKAFSYEGERISDILGIGRTAAYKLVHSGVFKTVQIGTTIRVSKQSFDEWLDRQKLNHGDLKATQGDTGHSQVDMITKIYAHILDEDRKVNAQKFESAFYANPDLRSVHAPQEEKTQPVLDAQTLLSQLQQSPELLSNLTSLILAQAGR